MRCTGLRRAFWVAILFTLLGPAWVAAQVNQSNFVPAAVFGPYLTQGLGIPAPHGSYGAFAEAGIAPCNSIDFPLVPCQAPVASLPESLAQLVVTGGEGSSAAQANLLPSGLLFGASAFAAMPSSTTIGVNTYQLADLSVVASQSGTTGSQSAAIAAAWDTLTFSPTTPGTTGTLSWTISLTKEAGLTSSYDDLGTGLACLDVGTNIFITGVNTVLACPLENALSDVSPGTTSYSMTINLDQPLEIYEALGALAYNDFNTSSAQIDPAVTLTLPDGVSFTTASGLSGGTATTNNVPEPGILWLVGLGLAGVGLITRRERV
ncbi:MAG: PEP-CTERM sorting domain-containing protein [Rhodoferax sp.]|nr:PEP-CTERM sorting domain-containing protein [Rhodoferax sp.]